MTTVVKKWGNGLGIRLPKSVTEAIALGEGTSVTVEAAAGKIIIAPTRPRRYRLQELVRGITPQNLHAEIETGRPVGTEVW